MLNVLLSADFMKIFVPSIIAITVAFFSHRSAVTRQLNEQRRQERVKYLVSAFRSLMMASNNPNLSEAALSFRDASIGIQFLGTADQAEMMRAAIHKIVNKGDVNLDPLLSSLREDLRAELKLGPLHGTPVYWTHPNLTPSQFHQ